MGSKATIVIHIYNNDGKKIPEIEAAYLYTAKGWSFTQSGEVCAKTKARLEDYEERHFLKIPVSSLSPGAWEQMNISGNKLLWSKVRGDERKDKHRSVGRSRPARIIHTERNIHEVLNLDVEYEEFPF